MERTHTCKYSKYTNVNVKKKKKKKKKEGKKIQKLQFTHRHTQMEQYPFEVKHQVETAQKVYKVPYSIYQSIENP